MSAVQLSTVPSFAKHARLFALSSHRREPIEAVKSAVAATGTGDAIYATGHSVEYARAVRAASILGRLRGVVDVPLATVLPFLSVGTQAGFHGEGMPISVSAAALGNDATLFPHRVSALIVLTEELLKHSQAEKILEADMTAALATAVDARLLDPTALLDSEQTGPASVTSGVSPIDASGVGTASEVDALMGAMVSELIALGSTLENVSFITSPTVALAVSLLRDTSGMRAFPRVSPLGGTLVNIPVLVSASAPAGSLTLMDGSDLLIGDRGRANVGFSDSTSIDMSSEPDGTRRVSLYQSEAVALKISREISWKLRNGFVSYAANLDLPLPILPS